MDDLTNPYVGPRFFTLADREYFFGREREARDLLARVISERFVLFYAQSGAGKSSLVNTNLIPDLKANGFLVLPNGRVSGDVPDRCGDVKNIFAFNLMASLDQSQKDPNLFCSLSIKEFLDNLATTDGEYYYFDDSPADDTDPDEYQEPAHVLIIDQFEEIFSTQLEYWEHREAFFKQLEQAMIADPLLWVVLVLREDYAASLDPHAPLMANKMRARQFMQRLGFEAALEAVKKPAELGRRPFAPDVAERLVENLLRVRVGGSEERAQEFTRGQFIEPVQLQVVCFQLWEQLKEYPGQEITHEDLNRLAGGHDLAVFVNRALGDYYKQAIAKVLEETDVSERRLRDWFSTKLITEAETRGYIYQGEETTGGLPNQVIQLLQAEYLIRTEPKAGGIWVELVHDRFIGPIIRNNRDWDARNQNPLILDAEAWCNSNKDPQLLYEGNQLEQAFQQIKDHPEDNTSEVQVFLDASKTAADEEAAAREKRKNQILIRVAAALAVLTIWAVIASINAGKQATEARTQANVAATAEAEARVLAEVAAVAEAEARTQAELAVAAEAEARDQAGVARAAEASARAAEVEAQNQAEAARAAEALAQEAAAIAKSRELAAQASNALENQTDLAALLAIEAYRTQPTVESKNILLSLLERSFSQSFQQFGRPIPSQSTDVFSVDLSPDGTRLAWGLANGQVVVWNYLDQEVEFRFIGLTSPVLGLDFSPDNHTLAAGDETGRILLWDLRTGDQFEIPNVINSIQSLSFNDDGSRLAAAMGTSVRVWETATNQWTILGHRFNAFVRFIAWSPNGDLLAAGSLDRQVVVWESPLSEDPIASHSDHSRAVLSLAWSADNRTLASGSQDGSVIVWDVVTGLKQTLRDLHPGSSITSLAYSSDGKILATGSNDDAVVLLDGERFEEIARLDAIHDRDVNSLSFSPVRGQNLLASGSDDNSVNLLQIIAEDTLSTELTSDRGPVMAAAAPTLGQVTYVSNIFGQGTIWEWSNSGDTNVFSAGSNLSSSAISPGGDYLALGDRDGNIQVVNAATQEVMFEQAGQDLDLGEYDAPPQVTSLAFSWDGQTLASSHCLASFTEGGEVVSFCSDLAALLWDLDTGTWDVLWRTNTEGTETDGPSGHADFIRAMAFHPTESILATGSQDTSIILWDWKGQTNNNLPLYRHSSEVTSLAFSPNGSLLASADESAAIILWDSATKQPIGIPLTGSPAAVTALAFGQDNNKLYAGNQAGSIASWDVSFDSWLQRACDLAERNLSQAEFSQYFPDETYRTTCQKYPAGN